MTSTAANGFLLIPSAVKEYLCSNNAVFSSLIPKLQRALAHLLYSAAVNRHPHFFDPENVFPIHWKDTQKAFGSAQAFKDANEQLDWFAKVVEPKVGRHASGYCLTVEGRRIAMSYFEQSLTARSVLEQKVFKSGLEGERGKTFNMPRQAIASKTASGGNALTKEFNLRHLVKVDIESIKTFYIATRAWQKGESCLQEQNGCTRFGTKSDRMMETYSSPSQLTVVSSVPAFNL